MVRFLTVIIFFVSTLLCYASADSTMIVTPGYENTTLAKIGAKNIKEFDVFGAPGINKSRSKLSSSKRFDKIQDYILDVIFQTEGNITEVTNSGAYKKSYELLIRKEAVNRYREDLTEKYFLSIDKIKEFYELNKDKYPSGMKEVKKIKTDLKKSNNKAISLYISEVLDSLKVAHKVIYNEELLSIISKIEISDPYKFADSLLLLGANNELVTYKNKRSNISDLSRVVKELKPYHMNNLKKVRVIKSLVDGKILNELLTNVAEQNGYLEDKKAIERTTDNMKFFISLEYKKRLFSPDNLKPSKDELIDYYIEHKDDAELKTIRKMWTYEIFKSYDNNDDIDSNDKIKVALELENIRQKILAGESFEKYAKFYARPNTRDGELGFIYKTDHAMIGETAYQTKLGKISELIIQKKAISIIKVTEIKEPQLYKFDYVEEIIKKRVIEKKRENLKNELRKKLFKKYKVDLMSTH